MEKNYRRCISCRQVAPKSAFWRIVRVYPSNEVKLDEGMGRSAYLCPTRECLQMAQKKKAIRRSLRVPEHPDIYQTLWERLDKAQHQSHSAPLNAEAGQNRDSITLI